VLVDQHNGNVLALLGEAVEGSLDSAGFRLVVDNKEVLLCVWGLGDMLSLVKLFLRAFASVTYANAREQHARYCVLPHVSHNPTPFMLRLWIPHHR
jgi:hypothetical protein